MLTTNLSFWSRYRRLALIAITLIAVCSGALIWILSQIGIINTVWATICSVLFATLAVLLALFGFIVSPAKPQDSGTVKTDKRPYAHRFLHVAKDKGAIVVYAGKSLVGATVQLSSGFDITQLNPVSAASIIERKIENQTLFLAMFPIVELGNYTVYTESRKQPSSVSVFAGYITEVDWRHLPLKQQL